MQSAQSALEALIAETRLRPVSRLSFIRRALALGLSGTAIAGLLEEIEGPIPAGAATTPASSPNSNASHREIPCASAYVWSRAVEESPIPRRGRLTIRCSETAS